MANDILLSADGDVITENGDLKVGYSTVQHQNHLLQLQKGELKNAPTAGVGVINFLDDENPEDLLREMRKEYTADGMKVNDLKTETDGAISVDAEYE